MHKATMSTMWLLLLMCIVGARAQQCVSGTVYFGPGDCRACPVAGWCECSAGAVYMGPNDCRACQVNNYCNGTRTMMGCPAHSTTVAPGDFGIYKSQITDCKCVAGYERTTSNTCVGCGADTWSALGSACVACPAYSHSPPLSVSIDACVCDAPRVMRAGACVLCDLDTYWTPGGCVACRACVANASLVARCWGNSTSDGSRCECNAGFVDSGGLCVVQAAEAAAAALELKIVIIIVVCGSVVMGGFGVVFYCWCWRKEEESGHELKSLLSNTGAQMVAPTKLKPAYKP